MENKLTSLASAMRDASAEELIGTLVLEMKRRQRITLAIVWPEKLESEDEVLTGVNAPSDLTVLPGEVQIAILLALAARTLLHRSRMEKIELE